MNDELSKALDGAMADAAEIGTLQVGKPHQFRNDFCCNVQIGGDWDIACYGTTEAEALTRARLIERAVNGMGAQAQRIAELEAALEKIGTLTAYAGTPDGLRLRILQIIEPLSAKGGA